MNIQHLGHAFFPPWLAADDICFFNPHAMLFDLGGTAKSRNFSHFRAHRLRSRGPLALPLSKVHRLVHDLQNSLFIMAELVELRGRKPQNERFHARSRLSFF